MKIRARVWLVAAVAAGVLAFSPVALHGQSAGQRLDQEFAALQQAIAALAQRVAALEGLIPPPPPPPPPPVDTPPPTTGTTSPDGTVGVEIWTGGGDHYTFATTSGPYQEPVGFTILKNGQPLNGAGVKFGYFRGGMFVQIKFGYWYAINADGTLSEAAVGDPSVKPPDSPAGPVISNPGTPSPTQVLFPLPDPLPQAPPAITTNPQLLRVSDITPAIDEATGLPWVVDVGLAPWNDVTFEPIYDSLGYGASFKLRHVNGELRVMWAVGGDWNHPTGAREIKLTGLKPGKINSVQFSNAWDGAAFSGSAFSPGEHIGLWVDPKDEDRVLTCGSMDYVTHGWATVFERRVGPNGAVSDLKWADFGRVNKDEQGRLTNIDGLNGKECFGGFAHTPLWMQRDFGMGPMMILGGQYTSLVAQAATASMGLWGATFDDVASHFPQAPGDYVPTKVFADHKSGSVGGDWANPVDGNGNPKQAWAPGTQPFDRGKNIGGFIQNWLDGSVGIANASRSTLWKVDCEGTICTVTEGPPWAPNDQGAPDMFLFDWWHEGVKVLQHGEWKLFYPQSYIGIGKYVGTSINGAFYGTFEGTQTPVRFLRGLDATHILMDTDLGTLKDAYFIGPNVEAFYRQIGFDDRNQWNGVFPDGAGRWPWGTGYEQTLTMVGNDAGTGKYGLIGIYNGMLGQVFYDHSTFQSDSRVFEWHIFDPKDFGKVALGQMAPHMVQPAEMVFDPVLTEDGRRFGRTQGTLSWGEWASLALDSETGDIYVFGPLMASATTGGQLRIRKYNCAPCAAH